MESEICPKCKTAKYANPKMKLMINVCGHSLCETCVENTFIRAVFPCPTCNKNIKKGDYRIQLFEDTYIEKEIAIRKKMLKDFNETEKDFPSLKEFNDYLEKIENFIFNLANNVDEDKTVIAIDEYKKELKQMHAKNKQRPAVQSKENQLFVYKQLVINLDGPKIPEDTELTKSYTKYLIPNITDSQKSGGFLPIVPVKRQLQDAFSGLFITARQSS